jgi:hypothetical protein
VVRRSPSARNSSRPLVTKSDAALWAPSGMVGAGLTNCKLLARLLLQFRRLMRTSRTPLSYFPRIWRSRQTRSTPPPKGHGTLNVVAYFFRWQVETGSLPTN